MDKHKIMVVAGVGGVGLVAVLFLRSRAAASTAAANSATANTSGNIDLGSLSSLAPASTGVSTGGTYAVGASGGTTGDTTNPSLDPSSSVASFAQLLQGILSSGAQTTAAAQQSAANNNSQATQAIQAATPTPTAPVSTDSPSVPAYTGPSNLVNVAGGYLSANPGLYATDTTYRNAWNSVSSANQARFGAGWNSVASGADAGQLNVELSDAINPNWRNG